LLFIELLYIKWYQWHGYLRNGIHESIFNVYRVFELVFLLLKYLNCYTLIWNTRFDLYWKQTEWK
jgi:hypothetical protein